MSKKVLFVQGGGVIGAYVYGVLLGISDILNDNCLDIFDEIYSSSASSCTMTYFLSNQAQKEGMKIWTHAVTRKEFIDFKKMYRVFQKKTPYLNSHYLTETIFRENHMKLNYDELRKRINKLHYTLFNINTNESEFLTLNSNFKQDEIHTLLNASTAIPILYDKSVELKGEKYIDGAVGIDFPNTNNFSKNSKIMIITSEEIKNKNYITSKLFLKLFSLIGNLPSHVYKTYCKKLSHRNQYFQHLSGLNNEDNIFLLFPKENSGFNLANNSPKNIYKLIQEGKSKAYENEEKIKEFLLK